MKNSRTAIHAMAWIAIIAINFFVLHGSGYTDYPIRMISTTVIWLSFFYINYLIFIPRLLFKKCIILYVFSTIFLFAGAFYLSKYTDVNISLREVQKQYEALAQYGDVKESWESKTEEYRKRRERERKEPQSIDTAKIQDIQIYDTLRRRGRANNRYGPVPPPFENGLESAGFTDREEEYDRAIREYERTYRRHQWFARTDYNPFEWHNTSYIFILVFFFLASLALAFMDKLGNESQRRTELENEKVATELAYLKQQINPHFLFNTLNAIYSYTISVSDEASDAVLKLSAILRYMLYETDKKKVPLIDEITVVNNYIELQKLRITDKTEINFEIIGDPVDHLIEPMILIPILENAFKYGVDSLKQSFIYIKLDIRYNEILFKVSNRIVKRVEENEKSSGIGIKNIRRRLNLIYGNNYKLETFENNGIFNVSLILINEKKWKNEMFGR